MRRMSLHPTPSITPSAWLLAQASLAANHPMLRGKLTTLHCPIRGDPMATRRRMGISTLTIGPGLDGSISLTTGFLSAFDPEPSLPSAFEPWEEVIRQIPMLLREGRMHHAVLEMPKLEDEITRLERRYLARAAIVLSSLLHAYVFEVRNIGNNPSYIYISRSLTAALEYVNCRMARRNNGRMTADDFLQNYRRVPGHDSRVGIEYFDVPEEDMSVGVQIRMEEAFAPALEAMTNIQKCIASNDEATIILELTNLSAIIIDCARVFISVRFRGGQYGIHSFDPVYWAKTYPEVGRKVRSDEMDNSGINSPMFHALDEFFEVIDQNEELHRQQLSRRKLLPAFIQYFLRTLADNRYSIRSYVTQKQLPVLTAAFDATMQTYHWLLEKHRIRAVSTISIALASGRPSTAGGVTSTASHARVPIEAILDQQMRGAIAARMKNHPETMQCIVDAISMTGSKTTSVTLRLPCPVPIEPGDRVRVWPKAELSPVGRDQLRWLLGETFDVDSIRWVDFDELDLHMLHPGTSFEEVTRSLHRFPPRHYTVSRVSRNVYGYAEKITLTVAHSDGLASRYMCSVKPGEAVAIRLLPQPQLRLPLSQRSPLLLIAQGAGVGPFLGFIEDRANRYDHPASVGSIELIVSAKTLSDVPYLAELSEFTRRLPQMTLHLALSRELGFTIRRGRSERFRDIMKVQRVLAALQSRLYYQQILRDGDIFVCGSVGFGATVRKCLVDLGLFRDGHYHEDCFGGDAAPGPKRNLRQVSVRELAEHNSPESLWMAVNGMVYDLTEFSAIHPGGLKTLLESAGMEADDRFRLIHSGDGSQGILSHAAHFIIGPLTSGGLPRRRVSLLRAVVRAQNVLRNNTIPPPGRHMPFYVFADSLAVTCRDVTAILRDIIGHDATLPDFVIELADKLNDLRRAGWWFLGYNTRAMSVEEREKRLQNVFATFWIEFHGLLEALKAACGDEDTVDDDDDPDERQLKMTALAAVYAAFESMKATANDHLRDLWADIDLSRRP